MVKWPVEVILPFLVASVWLFRCVYAAVTWDCPKKSLRQSPESTALTSGQLREKSAIFQ